MKTRNFPGKKVERQLNVKLRDGLITYDDLCKKVEEARKIRTKKYRG